MTSSRVGLPGYYLPLLFKPMCVATPISVGRTGRELWAAPRDPARVDGSVADQAGDGGGDRDQGFPGPAQDDEVRPLLPGHLPVSPPRLPRCYRHGYFLALAFVGVCMIVCAGMCVCARVCVCVGGEVVVLLLTLL